MSYLCNGTYYDSEDATRQRLYWGDTYTIPGTPYSFYQGLFDCANNRCSGTTKKNGSNLGIDWYSGSTNQHSYDTNKICVFLRDLDCVFEWADYDFYYILCSTYNDVYVNTSTGNDNNCGNTSSVPVKTFQTTYNLLNTNGTIHVLNSGADFSAETVTFTKGFSITVDGDGNCYLPVLS